MNDSLWRASLASFADEIARKQPAPAGVAASAVTAVLGVSLLIKVLEIRKVHPEVVASARRVSDDLRRAADLDVAAVQVLIGVPDEAAVKNAIAIPLRAACSALEGLELCASVAGEVKGLISADLAAAAELLSGAIRAILLCAQANLKRAPDELLMAECTALEKRFLAVAARCSGSTPP
jgi:formiminotetrahydrofolate cyclodeaminase